MELETFEIFPIPVIDMSSVVTVWALFKQPYFWDLMGTGSLADVEDTAMQGIS